MSSHRARATLREFKTSPALLALAVVLPFVAINWGGVAADRSEWEIEYSLCPTHRKKRLMSLLGYLAVTAAAIAGAYFVAELWAVTLAFLVVVLGAAATYTRWQSIRASHLDAFQAYIEVGEPFAASFAEAGN